MGILGDIYGEKSPSHIVLRQQTENRPEGLKIVLFDAS